MEPSKRNRRIALVVLAAATLTVVGIVSYGLFAPKPTTTVDQSLGEAMDGGAAMEEDAAMGGEMEAGASLTALASGTFSGADRAHNVEGTVTLYADGKGGHFLRFEEYDATSGPDVYLYLTQGSSTDAVETEGLRVLVPGGAEGGQATLRGNFNVPLPEDFDPAAWDHVLVWCQDFNVLFGSAALA